MERTGQRLAQQKLLGQKKIAKKSKDPNSNIFSHGKLEKGERKKRGGEKRLDRNQFVWKHLENERSRKPNKHNRIPQHGN